MPLSFFCHRWIKIQVIQRSGAKAKLLQRIELHARFGLGFWVELCGTELPMSVQNYPMYKYKLDTYTQYFL